MDDEFKSELIEVIRGHEIIWNPESPDYKHKKSLAETWGKITLTLGRNGVRKVRQTWKTLRTQFAREANRHTDTSTHWKYFESMRFIETVIKKPMIVKKPVIKKTCGNQGEKTDILNDPVYGNLDNIESSDFVKNWLFSNEIVSDPRTLRSPSSRQAQSFEVSTSTRELVCQSTDNGRMKSDISIFLFVLSLVQEIKLAKCIASLKSKILDVISKHPTTARPRISVSSQMKNKIEKHFHTQVFSNRSPDNDEFIILFVCSLVPHLLPAKNPAALKYKIWKIISEHRQEEQKEEEEEDGTEEM